MQKATRKFALRLARSYLGGRLIGAAIRAVPDFLPGLILKTDCLVILRHPVPSAANHCLAVPRKSIANIKDTGNRLDNFLTAFESWWMTTGMAGRIVTNLGSRQEVRLLHLHLFTTPQGVDAEEHSPASMPLAKAMSRATATIATDASGSVIATRSTEGDDWRISFQEA